MIEQDAASGRWYVLDEEGARRHGPYLDEQAASAAAGATAGQPAKLVVEIDLGNDAMQTAAEAGDAINRALVGSASPLDPLGPGESGTISDANGNGVGAWRVVEQAEPIEGERRYLVLRYDVTGLPEAEIDALAFEAAVQAESSDGHRGVPEPTDSIEVVAERRSEVVTRTRQEPS